MPPSGTRAVRARAVEGTAEQPGQPDPGDPADQRGDQRQRDHLGRGQPGQLPLGRAARGQQRGLALALGGEQPGDRQQRRHREHQQLERADPEQRPGDGDVIAGGGEHGRQVGGQGQAAEQAAGADHARGGGDGGQVAGGEVGHVGLGDPGPGSHRELAGERARRYDQGPVGGEAARRRRSAGGDGVQLPVGGGAARRLPLREQTGDQERQRGVGGPVHHVQDVSRVQLEQRGRAGGERGRDRAACPGRGRAARRRGQLRRPPAADEHRVIRHALQRGGLEQRRVSRSEAGRLGRAATRPRSRAGRTRCPARSRTARRRGCWRCSNATRPRSGPGCRPRTCR